mmetsp:Transcript_19287/g.28726  ORF Transcript_19287/g.28726 Transcript_19287/m.28726 type:complete len:245 (-) Transcript_19287:16-750(-)
MATQKNKKMTTILDETEMLNQQSTHSTRIDEEFFQESEQALDNKQSISLDPAQGLIDLPANAKMAVTEFRCLDFSEKLLALMELTPTTGRKHQLRVHCASVLNSPIVGDFKYAPNETKQFFEQQLAPFCPKHFSSLHNDVKLCLHARALVFRHPCLPQASNNRHRKNYPLLLTAPLPQHMLILAKQFGLQDMIKANTGFLSEKYNIDLEQFESPKEMVNKKKMQRRESRKRKKIRKKKPPAWKR